jgi:hypothetical protein
MRKDMLLVYGLQRFNVFLLVAKTFVAWNSMELVFKKASFEGWELFPKDYYQ